MADYLANYIREQFPSGTRVRLDSGIPSRSIPAGITGLVDFVCESGDIFVDWDDGSRAGLTPGIDQFAKIMEPLHTLKMYMPLTGRAYLRNGYGDMEDDPIELDGYDFRAYEGEILTKIKQAEHSEEMERGLMHWYHEKDSVNEKIASMRPTVEVVDRQLVGVVECRVHGTLTPEELGLAEEYVTSQMSDGWGEGFEQREIQTSNGELYVSFWNSGSRWQICSQELCDVRYADQLPELCFSVDERNGQLMYIKRGERGCFPSSWECGDPEKNRETANRYNQRFGVSSAQEKAMVCGSMLGWETSASDPSRYEQPEQGLTMR